MRRSPVFVLVGTVALFIGGSAPWPSSAQKKDERPPHGQDRVPGPALSPAEALKKFSVPPGFAVELVAAEPDIVNPVAMTFDERGRVWITESLEYPKRAAGPGRDRVKVLESTKGDGKFDKVTTVIEGLNIPSGVAVGWGGVWVANSPDILFYPFEDVAAPKLGKPQVVVTGFGRDDTHELPNSLTWGPDGWLYGLNGVFNPSKVKQGDKEFRFTCALFRIDPKTKKFELFCEGTSNPWGVAFDGEGSAFVSACVIDHLWHLTESGYYHRQGGPYPPYTWKIGSIVKHRHQKAAYCGITWLDSDAFPPEYREKLYMGNIHGNAINCDALTRDGSTYFGKPALSAAAKNGVGEGSNFLLANDPWFMPVAQKVGPDGCLYVLDWYDRYHCYQDANRDPKGIDRLKGRLYRITYKNTPPAGRFDLAAETDDKLLERLRSPNVYFRETAQRLLSERVVKGSGKLGSISGQAAWMLLLGRAHDEKEPRKARLHAFWALAGGGVTRQFVHDHPDPTFRAWGVRAIATNRSAPTDHVFLAAGMADDRSPDVRLQVAIAARRLEEMQPKEGVVRFDAMELLLKVAANSADDPLIPHIVWQNLHPLLEGEGGTKFIKLVSRKYLSNPGVARLVPRALDRILDNPNGDPGAAVGLLEKLDPADRSAGPMILFCLTSLAAKVQNGELAGDKLAAFRKRAMPLLARWTEGKEGPLQFEAGLVAASLGDKTGLAIARDRFTERTRPLPPGVRRMFHPPETRVRALYALIAGGEPGLADTVAAMVADPKEESPAYRGQLLAAVARVQDPRVADAVLEVYPKLAPELQPKAIELLTQRPNWSKQLLREIGKKKLPPSVLNANQARRLLMTKDGELVKLVTQHYGTVRDGRNPDRELLIARVRQEMARYPGNPVEGAKVFKKVCAQCHKIYGEGVEVGPDITSNGRASFDQLLSNLLDPSLVIGADYQATTVVTTKGQLITGLLTEDNAQRVVLKTQGGKLETVPRDEIESVFRSNVSMMPEDLERQLQPVELYDLLRFLMLDRPPGDPKARYIPGTP